MNDRQTDNAEIVAKILGAKTFKRKAQLYNDHIRSFAIYHFNGEDRNYSFWRSNTNASLEFNLLIEFGEGNLLYLENQDFDPKKRAVLSEIRVKEYNRIKDGLNTCNSIEERIEWLFANVAGMTLEKLYECQDAHTFGEVMIKTKLMYYRIIGNIDDQKDQYLEVMKKRIMPDIDSRNTFEGMKKRFEDEIGRLPDSKRQNKLANTKKDLREYENNAYYSSLLNGRLTEFGVWDLEYRKIKERIILEELFKFSCWLDNYDFKANNWDKNLKKEINEDYLKKVCENAIIKGFIAPMHPSDFISKIIQKDVNYNVPKIDWKENNSKLLYLLKQLFDAHDFQKYNNIFELEKPLARNSLTTTKTTDGKITSGYVEIDELLK